MLKSNFPMTKIIATLGPATSSVKIIERLIREGARVFRINFSHGTFDEFDQLIKNIREASKNTGAYVGILGDLSGPKIRVGKVIPEGVVLKKNMEVHFIKTEITGGSQSFGMTFSTTCPEMINEVKPGEKILLDDGNIELKALTVEGRGKKATLTCKVMVGGLLTSSKGINLPHTNLSLPSMTEKDFKCAKYAVEKKLDFLALSFVRTAKDISVLKNYLENLHARPKGLNKTRGNPGFTTTYDDNYIPVISKIEKPQAIDNLDEIVIESDGIMVARGDLGVEMDLAEVAILQKDIIKMCKKHMKPVIVATQMLQSMIHEPVPTRAEVSDVANAIMDGADAVMLSGETAVGEYPAKAVKMMHRIAKNTHIYLKSERDTHGLFMPYEGLLNRKATMARGVKMMTRDIQAKYIITWMHSGGSTVFLSQQHMEVPIIACGENTILLQQLSLLHGVYPVFMKQPLSGSQFIAAVNKMLIDHKWAKDGDPVIVVASSPITHRGITNRLVIHSVGEQIKE